MNHLENLISIVHESVDLFEVRVDVTITSASKKILVEFETGESVCIVGTSDDTEGQGLHGQLSMLDEYDLSELVEQAVRGGYQNIFINLAA